MDTAKSGESDSEVTRLPVRNADHLHLITEKIPALISYVDSETKFCYVNNTFEAWYQTSAESVVRLLVESVVGAEN